MFDAAPLDPKYEVIRKLREGGMGTIYLVRHRLLEELRVIKVLKSHVSDRDLEERFVREAKTAIQLRHPNIAQLYDFSIDAAGAACIVMEYIEGVNLHDWHQDRSEIDIAETIGIARQALRALEFLHRKGYVHRDVSPDNLMLTRDADGHPLVKLIDLGIVKILREDSQATATSLYLGKPRYSSPEQLSSTQVDARSDLYSFGVMLYELVTGRYPITGQDLPSIVTGHLYLAPLSFDLSDPGSRVPEALRALILQALAKKPEDRPSSAEAFGRKLNEILREIEREAEHVRASARAAEIVRLLAETERAIEARKLPEALAKLGEVLNESPDDPKAIALRERLDAAFVGGQTMGLGDTQPFRVGAHAAELLQRTLVERPQPPLAGGAVAATLAPTTIGTASAPLRSPSRRRSIVAGAAIAALVGVVALVAVLALLRSRGDDEAPSAQYADGVAALERGGAEGAAAAAPLLRAAAGFDPIERDGYLPFYRLGVALAATGDCDAAEVAFQTSLGQKAVERDPTAMATIVATRDRCARRSLEPEIAAFDRQLADLEAKARSIARDRVDPSLAALWSDASLGQELDRIQTILEEARTLLAAAGSRGERASLYAAQDRYADAQLALGALLQRLAGS